MANSARTHVEHAAVEACELSESSEHKQEGWSPGRGFCGGILNDGAPSTMEFPSLFVTVNVGIFDLAVGYCLVADPRDRGSLPPYLSKAGLSHGISGGVYPS